MATKAAVGKKKSDALNAIALAVTTICERVGLEYPNLYPHDRDKEFRQALMLETLAAWLDLLSDALAGWKEDLWKQWEAFAANQQPEGVNAESDKLAMLRLTLPVLLSSMKVDELKAFAERFGIDMGDARLKAEIVNVISERLTGKGLELVAVSEVPEDTTDDVIIDPVPEVLDQADDLEDDQALRIFDLESVQEQDVFDKDQR